MAEKFINNINMVIMVSKNEVIIDSIRFDSIITSFLHTIMTILGPGQAARSALYMLANSYSCCAADFFLNLMAFDDDDNNNNDDDNNNNNNDNNNNNNNTTTTNNNISRTLEEAKDRGAS